MRASPSPTRSIARGRALAAVALVLPLALAASACSWSVPADPGENVRLRSRGADADPAALSNPPDGSLRPASVRAIGGDASDDGARTIYLTRCGRCHEPFSPRRASAGEWPGIVRKMGPRAGLFGEERDRVLRWLQANAR